MPELSPGNLSGTLIPAIEPDVNEILSELWLDEFCRNGLCMLCGNSGIITNLKQTGPVGQKCGGIAHCICPNGRRRKELNPNEPLV